MWYTDHYGLDPTACSIAIFINSHVVDTLIACDHAVATHHDDVFLDNLGILILITEDYPCNHRYGPYVFIKIMISPSQCESNAISSDIRFGKFAV